MNIELEEKFVKNFINTSYCERLLFELKSFRKRTNAIDRFSHNTEGLVKKEYVYLKLKNFDENELKKFLNEQNFYVISFKYLDGIIMDNIEVFDYIYNEYSPVIVCGNNIAVIKKEYEKGDDNYYLLKK